MFTPKLENKETARALVFSPPACYDVIHISCSDPVGAEFTTFARDKGSGLPPAFSPSHPFFLPPPTFCSYED